MSVYSVCRERGKGGGGGGREGVELTEGERMHAHVKLELCLSKSSLLSLLLSLCFT